MVAALEKHRELPGLERRARTRAGCGGPATRSRRSRVTALREQWRGVHENAALDELAAEVVAGDSDPYAAADLLLESLDRVPSAPDRNPGRESWYKGRSVRELRRASTFPRRKEHPMDGALKKGVVLLVILFLGFWLVQDPDRLRRQRQADRHRHLGPAGAAVRRHHQLLQVDQLLSHRPWAPSGAG